jgi:lipoprotein NlpI
MPGVADVHYHLGVVYSAMGQKDWARYHLTQALADSKDSEQSWSANAKDLLAKQGP